MMIIKVGEFAFKLNTETPYLHRLYKKYQIADDSPYLFEVEATEEAIAQLKAVATEPTIEEEYENAVLMGEVTQKLFHYSTILFHAATVAVDGQVYAFSATSGTGKSTHVGLWLKHFGDRAFVVNGDKPFLTLKDEQILVHGSPWCGKERLETNTSLPLKAICFIERGETNSIRRLDSSEVIDRLFKQVILPKDAEGMEKMMQVLDWIFAHIPFYELHCTISDEAVTVAYEGMQE